MNSNISQTKKLQLTKKHFVNKHKKVLLSCDKKSQYATLTTLGSRNSV